MIGVDLQDIFSVSLPCSWRGIDFYVVDTRLSAGRRVQKLLFPGIDTPAFQDLGALDGPIVVSGLLVGDDYVRQAEALRAAFRTAASAKLTLPWLSSAPLVVLAQPAEITFSIHELRVARFSAQFEISTPYQAAPLDTLEQLQAAISGFEDQVKSFVAGVLSPLQLPIALFGYAERFAGYVGTAFSLAAGLGGQGDDSAIVAAAVATPLISLSTAAADVTNPAWSDNLADALFAVPEAAAAASVPTPPASVAPGGSVATPTPADPRATATMLLAAGADVMSAAASDPAPGAALSAALAAGCVAQAIGAASDILYASQQDASAFEATLVGQLDDATEQVALQCQAYPLVAGPVWRAMVDLRSALVIDMQAVIGRLPSVDTLIVPRPTSVWALAQYLSGDTPANLIATYQDLVARNAIYHPALVAAGPIEYLA
jgi:prophage DNA circulation protein